MQVANGFFFGEDWWNDNILKGLSPKERDTFDLLIDSRCTLKALKHAIRNCDGILSAWNDMIMAAIENAEKNLKGAMAMLVEPDEPSDQPGRGGAR